MTRRIKLEPRAAAEIEAARNWWLDNRPDTRGAFDEELEWAFEMITTLPDAGQPMKTLTSEASAVCSSRASDITSTTD